MERYELLTRHLPAFAVAALTLAAVSPGRCWLFDAGPPQHAGAMVRDGSNLVAAAAPFAVRHDSCLTSVGAAMARAFGPVDAGFRVYLTRSLTPVYDLPTAALAEWLLVPKTAQLEYYYADDGPPIFIEAGRIHYLVFVPTAQDFWGAISWSLIGFYGRGNADYGPDWRYLEFPLCIRVDGYVIPEPSTAAAACVGLLGLATRRVSFLPTGPWLRRMTGRREPRGAEDRA